MAFNGNGVFVRLYNWTQDALNNINILAARMDNETNGIASGLSNCVTRDGQSPPTQNLPMGGKKLTGIADGSALTDSASYGQAVADFASTAASKGASLVAKLGSGTMQDVASTVYDYSNDTKFITNLDGAKIARFGPRGFFGGAVTNDGNFPNVTKDWLTTFETTIGARPNGTLVSSQIGILNNNYFGAGVALLNGVRTVNFVSAATGASANTNIAVNNNATLAVSAWAGYDEAHRDNDVVGSTIGREIDVRNAGSLKPIHPYTQDAKMTVALQIAAGSEYPLAGQFDVSAAINIRDNPTAFKAGIVFGSSSITGTNGVVGTGNAMLLATRHRITWTLADGTESGSVQSTITAAGNNTRLAFSDLGMLILGPTDNINIISRPVASAANYLDFSANTAGNAPVIRASGSDTNVDLQVQPQGSGLLRFGNSTSMVANGVVATVLGSLGPTGSRTTVQKWLSVKDSTGAQLYIPCF